MGELATPARFATLDRLERESFDCAVIGGGISGAGVAREAALRGLSVALLEAEDFSSGTSSRSTKLIHGGLRYLAMGDVALVRTTALERKQIFRLAPHLAERRWMVVPARSWAGLLKMRVGITVYEKLGAVEKPDLHQNWGAGEIEREEPMIDASIYKHACAYREYLTDDAHLVLANLRSAAGLGAAVLNHARVEAIVQERGRAAGVEAVCRLSGRRVRVRARCVINAAGPWVEAVRRLESPAAPPLLHLSKGVHVVVTAERLPVRNLLFLETQDGRSIFVIRRGPCVVIGTTDTSWTQGAGVWPEITREDVDYLLEIPGRYLRGEQLAARDVIGAWAGLRPLIAQPGKKPSEISRRDEVLVGPAGVITMAGGKLTGYRPLARETIERAAEVASLKLAPAAKEDPPLPGGDFDGDLSALESALVRETGVSAIAAARLARLHGTEAIEVARGGVQELALGVLVSEIEFAVRKEGAATLEDLLYRRLRTSLYAGSAREAAVAPAAERMARLLGWDAARTQAEMRGVRAQLLADLAFRDEAPSAGIARAVGVK
ncbi:MAG TPA: glycerol-3-phosphate dehydrogenase/oxidase [Myxococcota bacterium]|jgi:glycerol-3-phosphate dehydrogenase